MPTPARKTAIHTTPPPASPAQAAPSSAPPCSHAARCAVPRTESTPPSRSKTPGGRGSRRATTAAAYPAAPDQAPPRPSASSAPAPSRTSGTCPARLVPPPGASDTCTSLPLALADAMTSLDSDTLPDQPETFPSNCERRNNTSCPYSQIFPPPSPDPPASRRPDQFLPRRQAPHLPPAGQKLIRSAGCGW